MALCAVLAGCGLFTAGDRVPANTGKIVVRYRWTAADSEARPEAFHVHRSVTAAGPFERLNPEPIPAPRAAEGEIVTLWVDRGIPLGQSRFYYLEAVGRDGVARKVAPVIEAQAVLPLQEEDRAARPRPADRSNPNEDPRP
jgi:hypothetical protein